DPQVEGPIILLMPLIDKMKPSDRDALLLRYFGTLLIFQHGGDEWKRWNEWEKAQLVPTQRNDGDDAGSWDPHNNSFGERNSVANEPAAATAIAQALVKCAVEPI